jgi:hypothetical protein
MANAKFIIALLLFMMHVGFAEKMVCSSGPQESFCQEGKKAMETVDKAVQTSKSTCFDSCVREISSRSQTNLSASLAH